MNHAVSFYNGGAAVLSVLIKAYKKIYISEAPLYEDYKAPCSAAFAQLRSGCARVNEKGCTEPIHPAVR